MSINRVVLAGRLTKDPELRYSASGVPMCRFTVAVNRQFKKDGQDEADFINCLCFNKTAENLANFQKKGSLIGVDGRIQTGRYEKDGQFIYTTDVVADSIQFLESKKEGPQQPVQQQPQVFGHQTAPQQFNTAPQGHTQQQNFGHQAPQFGQQQEQPIRPPFDESNLPF